MIIVAQSRELHLSDVLAHTLGPLPWALANEDGLDDNGKLASEWMRGTPAPDAVLQLLSCKCVRSCKLPDCTCLANGLKCTDMCKVQICNNLPVEDEEEFFFCRIREL